MRKNIVLKTGICPCRYPPVDPQEHAARTKAGKEGYARGLLGSHNPKPASLTCCEGSDEALQHFDGLKCR